MPRSPSSRSKSPSVRMPAKPTLASNNVFGGGGGGDIFSFDSSSLSKHTLRQEPKKQPIKTKNNLTMKKNIGETSVNLDNTVNIAVSPTGGVGGRNNGVSSPFNRANSVNANSVRRMDSGLSLTSKGGDNILLSQTTPVAGSKFTSHQSLSRNVSNDSLSSPSQLNISNNNELVAQDGPSTPMSTTVLDSFLQVTPGGGGGGGKNNNKRTDKSGFFTNFALMEELKTSEQAVEYFLKRQSHKFPVKFLHLIPKEPGHSGFYPYDLEVVSQEVAEAADRHYVMTESGMTAFARVEVEDPSLLVVNVNESNHGNNNGGDLPHPPAMPPSSPKGSDELGSPNGHALTNEESKAGSALVKHAHKSNTTNTVQPHDGKPKFIVTETMSLGHWVSERNNYRVISLRLIAPSLSLSLYYSVCYFFLSFYFNIIISRSHMFNHIYI